MGLPIPEGAGDGIKPALPSTDESGEGIGRGLGDPLRLVGVPHREMVIQAPQTEAGRHEQRPDDQAHQEELHRSSAQTPSPRRIPTVRCPRSVQLQPFGSMNPSYIPEASVQTRYSAKRPSTKNCTTDASRIPERSSRAKPPRRSVSHCAQTSQKAVIRERPRARSGQSLNECQSPPQAIAMP